MSPEKIKHIIENFTQCAHDARESLVDFATRLLETTREHQVRDITVALEKDQELARHLKDVQFRAHLRLQHCRVGASCCVRKASVNTVAAIGTCT